jgi:hypothetical protein
MKLKQFGIFGTGAGICALMLAALCSPSAFAWGTWSENPTNDTGNCATCHGKFGFVGMKYVSAHDGTTWTGDLMTGHGSSVLTGCKDCHIVEGDQALISRCAGCHGRDEDGGVMAKGAGLRQHHRSKGISECDICHGFDSDPVGEQVTPRGMRAKGIDPCNDAQFGPDGLDNDGDGLYDGADPDCQQSSDVDDGVANDIDS